MDTNYYDVVVCGGETTGLIAGALLARRGFRVLLIGHEADAPSFDAGGAPVPRAPALLPPVDEPPAARVLKELDCTALVRRRAPQAKPGYRVVLPGQTLDVWAEPAAFEKEAGRAFGAGAPDVTAAAARLASLAHVVDPLLASAIALPPHGFWERREVGRFESLLGRPRPDAYAPLGGDHPLRAIAAAPAALTAALVPHEIGPVGEARGFELARQGLHLHEGGLAGVHELLLGRLETFGGNRRHHLRPVEIVVKRGRVSGVRVQPRGETIGCEWLLWAGRARELYRALGTAPPAGARGRPRVLEVAGYRHALVAWVETKAIPEGTPAITVAIKDPTRPLLEDNAVLFTLGAPGPRAPGHVPVWVECVVPANVVDPGPSYLGALRGRLLHTLGRAFPPAARTRIGAASPYDGLEADIPGTSPGTPPGKSASGPVLLPPPVFALTAPRSLDVLGVQHATDVGNLYLAARENLPGLAFEGELLSGWGVARLVSGRHPHRQGPRRRMFLGG